jgi:hypothetical protein
LLERSIAVLALVILTACGEKTSESTKKKPDETTPDATTAATTSSVASNSATPGQPCSYITEAEATEIMGHPMKFNAEARPGECNFISASGDQTKSMSFQIAGGTVFYDAMASAVGNEPLSAIGDKAVLVPTTNMVAAVKGGHSYLGGVYEGGDMAKAKPKSVELAKKVVARM